MRTRSSLTVLLLVVALFLFVLRPPSKEASPKTRVHNAFEKFKHYGPDCNVSSTALYQPGSAAVCSKRTSLLEAMSSGGRIGRDAPYTARGCDMTWYDTLEVCEILGRFSQVMLVGDSMLRHIMGALNILIREDLGYGAVTDWNFVPKERDECFCLNQFNVKTCSVQGIYKTLDVLKHDPKSLSCPKLIPGWSSDLRIEQINRYPIPSEELARLRSSIHSNTAQKPKAFVLGQGLWNDLDVDKSIAWLDSVLSIINWKSEFQAPALLVTPNAAGKGKEDRWLISQGNKALVKFEESMAAVAARQGVEHLGTWNMSIQSTLYDGVHLDMRGNLLKAMMVVNWLSLLEV